MQLSWQKDLASAASVLIFSTPSLVTSQTPEGKHTKQCNHMLIVPRLCIIWDFGKVYTDKRMCLPPCKLITPCIRRQGSLWRIAMRNGWMTTLNAHNVARRIHTDFLCMNHLCTVYFAIDPYMWYASSHILSYSFTFVLGGVGKCNSCGKVTLVQQMRL